MNLYEIYLSGKDQDHVDEDGLVWKEILPEGESAYTPTPRGPVKRPFRVVAEGPGDLAKGVASLQEIKESFDGGAVENVQVILASKKKQVDEDGSVVGGDHDEITANNTGFVRKLRIADKPGKIVGGRTAKRLMAGIEFTEPEVKEKCERGTYANCSAGIVGGHVNRHTGREFPQALRHLSITNQNWVGDMERFGEQVMASDDDIDGVVGVNLDDTGGSPPAGLDALAPPEPDDIVWRDEDSADWVRERVGGALSELVKRAAPDESVHFWVKDVAPSQRTALVVRDGERGNGDSYVVPYEVDDGKLSVSGPQSWTQTRQVYVAAADELSDDQLRQRVQNALHYQLRLGDDYVVESVGKDDAIVRNKVQDATWEMGWDLSANQVWLDPPDEWRRNSGAAPEPRESEEPTPSGSEGVQLSEEDDTPQGRVRAAARRRRGLLNDNTGGDRVRSKTLDLDSLNLSDDQRDAIRAQLADADELRKLRSEAREREVDDKITALLGDEPDPGVAKFLRRIYVSDDGEPAAVLLADEDNKKEREITLSQAFDEFFELVGNRKSALLGLSSQGIESGDDHGRPPADASGEMSHEDRLKEAADVLKLDVREPVANR